AMRFVLVLAIVAMTIGYFGHRAASSLQNRAGSSKASISRVNELMRRAASGEPLDGRPAPDSTWVGRMTAACTRREARRARAPRPPPRAGSAARSRRTFAIYRGYGAGVQGIPPRGPSGPGVQKLRPFNTPKEPALERVVVAAPPGAPGRVPRQSVALREL